MVRYWSPPSLPFCFPVQAPTAPLLIIKGAGNSLSWFSFQFCQAGLLVYNCEPHLHIVPVQAINRTSAVETKQKNSKVPLTRTKKSSSFFLIHFAKPLLIKCNMAFVSTPRIAQKAWLLVVWITFHFQEEQEETEYFLLDMTRKIGFSLDSVTQHIYAETCSSSCTTYCSE